MSGSGNPDTGAPVAGTIDAARIAADIEAIAAFSESDPQVGYSRPTFSEPWKKAREYVISQAEAAGGECRVDAAGNVHIRHRSVGWEQPVWLSGSHIDSVPSGGKYDGVTGVVIPLEIMRACPALPLEIVVFAEEEGTTFNLGMLGSRVWTGEIGPDQLRSLTNRHGENVVEAGAACGVDAERLARCEKRAKSERDGPSGPGGDTDCDDCDWLTRIDPGRYLGMVEVHPEQGLSLWNEGIPLAAVDRINGRRQYDVHLLGQANHAGSTGMTGRRDALVGAGEVVVALEELGRELDRTLPYTVMTVGILQVQPGAINVIPGAVRMTLDFRAQDEEMLDRGEKEMRHRVAEIAERRRLVAEVTRTERVMPSPLSPRISRALRRAAKARKMDIPVVPSGALHDAAIIARSVPTAMIFVASRDGISHNPEEFSRVEDIALAARILADMIRAQDAPVSLDEINELPPEDVVDICGGIFEHSPWIVERALAARPFETREAFHRACMRMVERADRDQQTALIKAHPDLVGRLARQGRLTRESTEEQVAAGLDALTPEEIETFERYNSAYRERFGFPFVICARKNRKEAILEAFPHRLEHEREEEIETALTQIGEIAWLRLQDIVTENEEDS
jgi:allantoate deiminase